MSNSKKHTKPRRPEAPEAGRGSNPEGSAPTKPPAAITKLFDVSKATRELGVQRESLRNSEVSRMLSNLERMLQIPSQPPDVEQYPLGPKWASLIQANLRERPAACCEVAPFVETDAQREWRGHVLALADGFLEYVRWLESARLSVYTADEIPYLTKLIWFTAQVVRHAPLRRRTLELVAQALSLPTTRDPQHPERRKVAKEQVDGLRRAAGRLVADESTWPLAEEPTKPFDSTSAQATGERLAPTDPISMRVALERFRVSRSTLKRAVAKGDLRSYRRKGSPSNAEHIFSERELAAKYEWLSAPPQKPS